MEHPPFYVAARGPARLPLNGVPAARLRAGHARPLRSTRGSDLPLPGVFSGATGGHGAVKTAPYKPPAIAASRGRDDRLSKKVCSPLGPLCEGAPPAGGGGENCTAARNISGYGKVLSLRPFGAPPSQREVFRHAAPPLPREAFSFWHIFSSFLLYWNIFRLFCTNWLLLRFLLYYNDKV